MKIILINKNIIIIIIIIINTGGWLGNLLTNSFKNSFVEICKWNG